MKVVVHYAEIGLKGKNKPFFEKKLITNIKTAFKEENILTTIYILLITYYFFRL